MEKIKNKYVVNKFGGIIMGTPELLILGRSEIQKQIKLGLNPVVVVSALNGITDSLTLIIAVLDSIFKSAIANEKQLNLEINALITQIKERHYMLIDSIIHTDSSAPNVKSQINLDFESLANDLKAIGVNGALPILQDKVLAYGEKLAAQIFSAFLREEYIESAPFTSERIGIITDDNFLDAEIDFKLSQRNILDALKNSKGIPVIVGFTGFTKDKQITTLGRGGSDTTACFMGAALDAEKIILWKEVAGVLSGDPRIVSKAHTLKFISYAEAEESGKVVLDKAIKYISMSKVPTFVAYIRDAKIRTQIGEQKKTEQGAKMINFKTNLTLIVATDNNVERYGFLFRISQILTEHRINMHLIRNTRDSLYFVVEKAAADNLKNALQEINDKVDKVIVKEVAMLTIVGNLNWQIVNDFNKKLASYKEQLILGCFPYKDCTRLEAILDAKVDVGIVSEIHDLLIK